MNVQSIFDCGQHLVEKEFEGSMKSVGGPSESTVLTAWELPSKSTTAKLRFGCTNSAWSVSKFEEKNRVNRPSTHESPKAEGLPFSQFRVEVQGPRRHGWAAATTPRQQHHRERQRIGRQRWHSC
jgi:hypothetical protein